MVIDDRNQWRGGSGGQGGQATPADLDQGAPKLTFQKKIKRAFLNGPTALFGDNQTLKS